MNAAKLFGEYLGSTTAAYKEADLLQEACNKLNSSNVAEKILCAEIDVNVDGEPQRAKYRLDYLEDLRLNNPDIKYMYETNYMINQDVHKDFLFRVETLSYGVSFLDASMMGMGRGAGNCSLEQLIGFLKNPKYNMYYLLEFIEKHMLALKDAGIKWGYDIPYLFTGLLNQHPREAISFETQNQKGYAEFYKRLLEND